MAEGIASPILNSSLSNTMQINNQFSSIRGKIKILMVAVTDLDGTDQYERILALLNSLRDHTGLLVWCNSQAALTRLEAWMNQNGAHVGRRLLGEEIPAEFRCILLAPESAMTLTQYTHWVRDPFVWKREENGNLALLGSVDAKNEDSMWGILHLKKLKIAGMGQVALKKGAIPVAGGNLLFDEDFVLVGAKQFRESHKGVGSEEGKKRLLNIMNGNDSGRPLSRVIEIGAHTDQEPPKLVHLDLYLSLTGIRENGRCVALLGRCEAVNGKADPNPDVQRMIGGMNEYLDAVAGQLTAEGFAVRRNPLPVLQKRNASESYLCAYNNCLTEVTEGQRPAVWLARLTHRQEAADHYEHLKRLEDENIALWENLGFEVRLVEANFHSILDDQGSLHCITNEVLRI